MDDFKPGGIVRLKSGGPAMTVHAIALHDEVVCVWFGGNTRHTARFGKAGLVKVEASDEDPSVDVV